jgi:hypothetical protein
MKYPNLNIYFAWFFVFETMAMAWIAAAGNLVLQMLGVSTQVGFIPGRMVGALLLLFAIYLVWYFLRALPLQGKPEGNGYSIGHRVLLAANILAGMVFVFQFFEAAITDNNTHLILEKITTPFGYLAMAGFAIGFSLIYQSTLPQEEKS